LPKLIRTAPIRFRKSFSYAWDGFKATFRKEPSFQLEGAAFALLLLVLAFCPWPLWKSLTLVTSFLLIPLVEIINSAIEDICDLISKDFLPLIKTAKDKGALAVLLAIIINLGVLLSLLLI
jgi:diacylglycerol kinase (ATP)